MIYRLKITALIIMLMMVALSVSYGGEDPPVLDDMTSYINTCVNMIAVCGRGPCPAGGSNGGPGGDGTDNQQGAPGDPPPYTSGAASIGGNSGQYVDPEEVNPRDSDGRPCCKEEGAGGDPVDTGRTQIYEKKVDFSIGIPQCPSFHFFRIYTTGWMQNVYNDDYYPMLGKSWHLSVDTRLMSYSSTNSNIWVLLPGGEPRLLTYDSTNEWWRSDMGYGDAMELVYDDNDEEYTLWFPGKSYIKYNLGGKLVAAGNSLGNELTFVREDYTWQQTGEDDIILDRLIRIEAPSYDGRCVVLSYDTNTPYLVKHATLQNTVTNPTDTQILVIYFYADNDPEETENLLERVGYCGRTKGLIYEYGSWDEVNEEVEIFGDRAFERTLAARSIYIEETVGGSLVVTRTRLDYNIYRDATAWISESRPIRQQQVAKFSSTDPFTIDSIEKTFSIGKSNGESSGDVAAGSGNPRIYRGDFPATGLPSDSGDYSDYTHNGPHDITQTQHSGDAAGQNYQVVYDSSRNPTSQKHPTNTNLSKDFTWTTTGGSSTRDAFLKQAQLATRSDYQGRETEYEYNSIWQKTSRVEDPYGNVTTYTYDSNTGQLTYISKPNGETITYIYNGTTRLLTSVASNLKGTTSYTYYSNRRLNTVTNPLGKTTTYQYNLLGQPTQISSNCAPTFTYTYTDTNLTQITKGTDSTTIAYNDYGRKSSVTDAEGNTTSYTYDGAGRVIKVTDAESNDVEYSYNIYGKLKSFTDGEGNVTSYSYDSSDNLISESQTIGSTTLTTVYGYGTGCSSCGGGAGKVVEKTDAKDQTITTDYDDYGRTTYVKYYAAGDDPDEDDPVRTLTYYYNHTSNGETTDLVTKINDSAIPITYTPESTTYYFQNYEFSYNSDNKLSKIIHPEGWYQEFYYDTNGILIARRDIDGGVTEFTYNTNKQLTEITDPWGHDTDYSYIGTSDTGPIGAIKQILDSNNAKTEYSYNSLNRIYEIKNKASDNSIMTSFRYNSYDDVGNIIAIILNDGDSWSYEYDDTYQLTKENRVSPTYQTRWYREYVYDDAGNRTAKNYNDGSNTHQTSYAYNALNQLTSRTGADPVKYYHYDDNGNLEYEKDSAGTTTYRKLSWNEENRMTRVEDYDNDNEIQYVYDLKGSRIIRRAITTNGDSDGTRTRYFFNGITEEVVKKSVAGSHNDGAFVFITREDGESASDWTVYDNDPTGATVSSINDTDRRSNVIKCTGQNGNGFSTTGTWDEEFRVLSFWYKGGFCPLYVKVSTSTGSHYVCYYSGNGTNQESSGNVLIYLGTGAATTSWNRFERNIEEDWESESSATWTNTDQILIRPTSTASYDFYIDDIIFSNSRTITHNVSSGKREYMSDSNDQPEDTWYHFDHLGNVANLSDSSGDETEEFAQDAFGNVLSSTTTGAWASSFSGRHLTSKEYDGTAEMYYFYQRWYDPELGRFLAKAPYPPQYEHPYSYCMNNPLNRIDPQGLKDIPRPHPKPTPQPYPGQWGYDTDGDGVPDYRDEYPNDPDLHQKPKCIDVKPSEGDCLIACIEAWTGAETTVAGFCLGGIGLFCPPIGVGVVGYGALVLQYCQIDCDTLRSYGRRSHYWTPAE
jgi:RHS repeat-associated protein